MKVKCPYCGRTDYDIFDIIGGNGEAIVELCTCFECDQTFFMEYELVSIEKEDRCPPLAHCPGGKFF